jgi:hypothetical protein
VPSLVTVASTVVVLVTREQVRLNRIGWTSAEGREGVVDSWEPPSVVTYAEPWKNYCNEITITSQELLNSG